MGKTCVAANCTNRSDKKGNISFHTFPDKEKEPTLYKEWVRQVKRTRAEWNGPSSKHTFVCSDHFSSDAYDVQPQLMMDMGIAVNKTRQLKSGAVPTIFSRSEPAEETRVKRPRTAFEIREKQRVLDEALSSMEVEITSKPVACQTDAELARRWKKHKKIQAVIKRGKKRGTQTEESFLKETAPQKVIYCTKMVQAGNGVIQSMDDSINSFTEDSDDQTDKHSLYEPTVESENEAEMDDPSVQYEIPAAENNDILNTPKFIVFWSSLQVLLSWICCPSCGSKDVITTRKRIDLGTLLCITIFCESCGKTTNWKSQPFINNYPAGNVLLSAAILFSGSMCSKVLRVFKHMRLYAIEKSTFFRHQKELMYPAINSIWSRQQENLMGLLRARGDGIVLGGDGRADSMGHCAKYGIYTCIELLWNCIVDIKLVASSEVGGSYHMEKAGLQRCLNYLTEWVNISKLVTDRHRQIAKWVRENHAAILHVFDIWHVAKGVGKKLEAAAKLKDCDDIRPWIQSIINHMYWSAISTPEGQGEMILAKWTSVVNHVTNKHNHRSLLFPNCLHDALVGRERNKKWIKPGSKAAIQLEEICLRKTLLSDISKLSGAEQTWNLEAFHSLVNQFAPKMYAFTPVGMECRVKLAALHYNENAAREQQHTATGEPVFEIKYPKYKKGGYIVRKVLKSQTFQYVNDLWEEVESECQKTSQERKNAASAIANPPTLCANFVHPEKNQAIREHCSRYKSK